MFDQSKELTLGFLSERYVDARFWLNGRRYERVVDFYDTWLVESLEYESDPFPLTLWWDKRKLKARLVWEQQQKRLQSPPSVGCLNPKNFAIPKLISSWL